MRNSKEIRPENAAERTREVLREANISLSGEQINKLLSYYSLLIEKNKVMNLTAITDFEEALKKHFADSLAPLADETTKTRFYGNGIRILDLGTGAGLPGVPLAIALAGAEITLADSLQKRVAFLRDAKKQLRLHNVSVVNGRAEELGQAQEHRERYDLVVSRAVADLRVLCEYCLPLTKKGGCFVAWKGPGAQEEAKNAAEAICTLGGEKPEFATYALPNDVVERTLVIIEKKTETPAKYPRRAGIPTKRPL